MRKCDPMVTINHPLSKCWCHQELKKVVLENMTCPGNPRQIPRFCHDDPENALSVLGRYGTSPECTLGAQVTVRRYVHVHQIGKRLWTLLDVLMASLCSPYTRMSAPFKKSHGGVFDYKVRLTYKAMGFVNEMTFEEL